MRPPWHRTGWPGWALLALGVGTWDVLAPETMSRAWRRAHQHPASYAATVIAWTYVTAHLFSMIPPAYDPLDVAVLRLARQFGVPDAVDIAPARVADRGRVLRRPLGR